MKELKESMHNVERKYGIYPLVEHRIHQEDMVDDFNRKGFAGVVGHVNYDYDYPNNEAAWGKVKESFRKFLDNGMEGMIYDEFGYPSGTARGVVLENHPLAPEAAAQHILASMNAKDCAVILEK